MRWTEVTKTILLFGVSEEEKPGDTVAVSRADMLQVLSLRVGSGQEGAPRHREWPTAASSSSWTPTRGVSWAQQSAHTSLLLKVPHGHAVLQPEQQLGKELQTFSTGKATAGGAANPNADTWTESDHQKSGNSDLQIEVKGMQNTQRKARILTP